MKKKTKQEVLISQALGIKDFKVNTKRDSDKDGVPDYKDCHPWDPTRHGELTEKAKRAVKSGARAVKGEVSGAIKAVEQEHQIKKQIKQTKREVLLRALSKLRAGRSLTSDEREVYEDYLEEQREKKSRKEEHRERRRESLRELGEYFEDGDDDLDPIWGHRRRRSTRYYDEPMMVSYGRPRSRRPYYL